MDSTPADYVLRGLLNDCTVGDLLRHNAFDFNKNFKRIGPLNCESSINWFLDEGAINYTLNQKRSSSDSLMFKNGVVKFNSALLYRIKSTYKEFFDFDDEKDEDFPDNKYHGNILAVENKQVLTMVKSALASLVNDDSETLIIKQPTP